MRIGISTSVIQRGKTGIAQYIFGLLRGFMAVQKEHEFVLFALEQDLPLFEFTNSAMRIVPVPERYREPLKDIAWHQRELPRLAQRYELDVLHVPSYRRMLWSRPCALVATIHDLAPFNVRGKYDWKRMIYGRVVARRLAHRQHKIVVISQNTADDVRKYFRVPSGKMHVVYNGIDHARFNDREMADPSSVAQRHGIRSPFLLYVARLEHPGKNHVRLIEAFTRFKKTTALEWQLVLGGSDWSGAEHIHRAIKESPFAADIRAIGFVADSELPDLYHGASIFVYPSLYEGFGLPPLEAMACGCPVISSTGGALREMVGNAGILVEPTDTMALSAQMMRLASDPMLREYYRIAGLARAQQFNWETAARETLGVYARAVEDAGIVSKREHSQWPHLASTQA